MSICEGTLGLGCGRGAISIMVGFEDGYCCAWGGLVDMWRKVEGGGGEPV